MWHSHRQQRVQALVVMSVYQAVAARPAVRRKICVPGGSEALRHAVVAAA